MTESAVAICIAVINLITFALFGIDKRRAKKGMWRISEKTLLFFSAAFGAAGALFGMRIFHHKTRHKKFSVGVPLLLLLQILLVAEYFWGMP